MRMPGTEPERVKELDEAADTYYEAMQDRVRHSKSEAEAKDSLIECMLKHKVTRYENDHFTVTATSKTNVAVKPKKAEDGGGEE